MQYHNCTYRELAQLSKLIASWGGGSVGESYKTTRWRIMRGPEKAAAAGWYATGTGKGMSTESRTRTIVHLNGHATLIRAGDHVLCCCPLSYIH